MSIKPSRKRLKNTGFKRKPSKLKSSAKLGKGEKTLAWEKVRKELYEYLNSMNISTCEARFDGCLGTFALGLAHSMKRSKIKTQEDLKEAALLCSECHFKIEYSAPDEMKRIVKEIIENRAAFECI